MNWDAINLASSKFERSPEPPVLLGLIYRAKRHVVSGPPEAAKTLLVFIAGLEHMRADGSFVHVDFEMGPEATRLLLSELGATLEEIRAVHHYEPDGPPDLDTIEEISALPNPLLAIDAAAGAYDASGLDDNSRKDAERFATTWIRPFWQRGVATITVDHVVKNPDARGKFSIGSERKIGGADVHLGLEAVKPLSRGDSGLVKISTHRDRPGHLPRPTAAELHLTSDPDTHQITWELGPPSGLDAGDGFRPTVLMDRVIAHVEHYAYEPLSRSALVGAIRGNRTYLFQAIEILLAEGRLELDDKKVVPSSKTVPGTDTADENGNVVPSSLSLQEELNSGTVFEARSKPKT